MDDIFSKLKTAGANDKRPAAWFQQEIKKLGRVNPLSIIRSGKQETALFPGYMYLFGYVPENRSTLPYYDTFPLALPFRKVNDGFYAINFHYMPYILRIRVLDALNKYASDKKMDEKTRLRLNYNILESSRRLKPAKAAIKKYLYSSMRTRLKKIPSSDWVIASQLPVQVFRKKKMEQVWLDNKRKLI